MSYEACPNPQEDCPYYRRPAPGKLKGTQSHGCFSDSDHIIPQRLARRRSATRAEKQYIMQNPENREQLCRNLHNEKTLAEDDAELLKQLRQIVGGLAIEGVEGGEAA